MLNDCKACENNRRHGLGVCRTCANERSRANSWHPANDWIASQWIGKTVRQWVETFPDDPDNARSEHLRTSVVTEVRWESSGALHVKTADGIWCAARVLEVQA